MDTSYEEDEKDDDEEEEEEQATPLIPRSGIPMAVKDNRQPHEKQLAVYIILASTLFERIAFYTLAANIALNLETEKVGSVSPNGSITSFIFSGTSYVSTIVFAVISDAKLGRAKTILVGFVVYLIGYASAILITISNISPCERYIFNDTSNSSTTSEEHLWCDVWIRVTFIIIAIGAGAVQSNMAVFGAEQIQDSKITSRYFDKYVIVINISAIIAVLVIRTIYHDDKYYGYASIVAASVLFFAAVLFFIGWRYYIHVKFNETVITKCIPVAINAFQTWRKYEQYKRSVGKERSNSGPSNLISASHSLTEEEPIRIDKRPSRFLDFAKAANHGKFNDRIVDDVKSLRMAFIVFTLLIPFWLIYNQLNSTFAVQGRYMHGSYQNNMVAYMWLGDPVTIIIGILIFNTFVYKFLDARKRSVTIATKLVIGMCFACISMLIAGTVEKFRQDGCDKDYGYNQSNLTIYYQLPQNIFMGFSELFAMVASFEFAYFAAPRSAQTLFMSLRFCSIGISSFLGIAYMVAFSSILSKSDSSGSAKNEQVFFECPHVKDMIWIYYTYFYILAGLQFIFIIIFIVCQRKFRTVKLNPQQMETNQFLQHSYIPSTNRQ